MKPNPPFDRRRAGVLLHPTSLPGERGMGTISVHAYRFVDLLVDLGCSVWQTLPLGPTHADRSPYQSYSAMAGNPALIDWAWVTARGWAGEAESAAAWAGFKAHASAEQQADLTRFLTMHSAWLQDYALFMALKAVHQGAPWWAWPVPLRDRETEALKCAGADLERQMAVLMFEQYLFFRQWLDLKSYANRRGLYLFGDVPIFVGHDSADVWVNRALFQLDETGLPTVVAGVPPDYFSETGQRWGNPLYDWQAMADQEYRWWALRLRTQLELFDLLRIDHFRGLEAYWEIDAACETAVEGRWVKGPGMPFLDAVRREVGDLPLVAEDLGVITPEVNALRREAGLPGMKILQFAFDGDSENPYLPHHHAGDFVVYTGTHDNDTTLGWFHGLDEGVKKRVTDYLGMEPMPWPMIRGAMNSVAGMAVVPLQDILALDGTHRMNRPGKREGNWCWQFDWSQLHTANLEQFTRLVSQAGRTPLKT